MTRPGCMACTTEKPKNPTLATPGTKAATAAGKATAKGGAAAKKEAEPKAGGSGAAKPAADKKKQVIFISLPVKTVKIVLTY